MNSCPAFLRWQGVPQAVALLFQLSSAGEGYFKQSRTHFHIIATMIIVMSIVCTTTLSRWMMFLGGSRASRWTLPALGCDCVSVHLWSLCCWPSFGDGDSPSELRR